jgi:hypothetical protein
MDDFFGALGRIFSDNFNKSPEALEAELQKQLQELMDQMLGPEGSPMRKMLDGALGMGRNVVDEKAKKAFDAALKAKDEAYDKLLEYLHSKGLKPEEDLLDTTTDDIPVAKPTVINTDFGDEKFYATESSTDKLLKILRDKGIISDDDLK